MLLFPGHLIYSCLCKMISRKDLCSLILLIFLLLGGNHARTSTSKHVGGAASNKPADPFEQFAQFMIQSSKKGGDLDQYNLDEIRRAVKKLAGGQEALKTMDGAAHQLKSTFADRWGSQDAV
jgi:hypothetical protein